ncbi:hypothetical protein [Blastopirellula marina]|uniref:Uncharacterized protein n=1 Tax=Blastopirellula marina TaxID=124 RepID=A0A2S8F4U4_9BACT|nr:hypothetical protein [Blastopirellula marina]PQO27150.1 hypothetical protein C5Y98_28295 [Blastopirellula marina]PTL41297.1 hypothetical protein C5Y97_28310 [Blastopirellula marina]
MCQFNTATMSPGGNEELVRGLAKQARLKWEPLGNVFIAKQLEPGETYFFTTWGMCDCGSEVGSAQHETAPNGELGDLSRELKKLRQRGWSETKIERWLAQQKQDRVRKKAEWEARHQTTREELERWIEFVRCVLEQDAARWIGVMHHFYNHRIESAKITLTRQWIRLDQVSPEELQGLKPDVLLTIAKKG